MILGGPGHFPPLNESSGKHKGTAWFIVSLVILGLALRLSAYLNTDIINSDGAVFITQAKAIYYGLWGSVNQCTLPYPTITTFSIAAFYSLLGDWVVAATAVSLFYGAMTMLPLYLLAECFFDRETAAAATLIYAVTPVLVDGSVDIVRDPAFWFFSVSGLYFLVRQKESSARDLLLSSLFLILATWTRIEAIVYIAMAVPFFFVDGKGRAFRRTMIFLMPTAVIMILAIGSQMWRHPESITWYRITEIPFRVAASLSQYNDLRGKLAELAIHPPLDIPVEFFDNIKTTLWFAGLGVIFQNAMETFFYPFVFFYAAGLKGLGNRIRRDRRTLYFVMVVPAAFLLLYVYVFIHWEMENRWLAVALFPSIIFLGWGLERVMAFFKSRFNLKKRAVLTFLCIMVLISALPKNMKARGEDKVVFRTIGETIAKIEGNTKKIEVLGLGASVRWAPFYANVRFRGAPCPDAYRQYADLIGYSYDEFLGTLHEKGIQYVVWEEKKWPADRFDFLRSSYQRDFVRIGSWRHPDTGEMILFKVRRDT
jgi:4-amino-4-deoxy-L-arabinose transferase-like glycosyltransferase